MAKQAGKEDKKPNIFVRMGRKLKETFSELKRVTWPSFPKVVKSTCVVLVVVVVFLVVVTGINYGLQKLLELITSIGA
ncbi:MAG: preprotein translocase subunit SecE [Clostridia bacterium]|nr:preprotein translocase subunit SecE [Clostridia bacterium]